jgi:hypothetical protein
MRIALLAPLAALLVLAASCGGGGGSASPPASQTFDRLIDDAEQTPVEEPVLAYASQLCDPLRGLFDDASELIETFDALEAESLDDEDAFQAAFEALGELEGPVQSFLDDVRELDPPEELADFHASLIAELEYGLEGLRALHEDGILGAASLGEEPPQAVEPEGFQTALVRECGAELQDFIEELGGDILGTGDDVISFEDEPAAPPATGEVGDSVENGNFALVVHSVEDPYPAPDEYYQPAPGYRWVAVEVSLTNISDEEQPYFAFDFSLQDVDGGIYSMSYIDLATELESGSLAPGGSARGQVGFEVPEAASIVLLTYDPDFGDHVFEIALQ